MVTCLIESDNYHGDMSDTSQIITMVTCMIRVESDNYHGDMYDTGRVR